MIIIGLTGGIASGKTTISNFFKKENIPVHDSDTVVSDLYKRPTEKLINLLNSIGLKKATTKKKINKRIISSEVFNNRAKLKRLEGFFHKEAGLSRNKFIKKNKLIRKKIIVLDIPLLFENKIEKICDFIFLAHCPLKIRIKRAMRRKKMKTQTLQKIIALQTPELIKLKKSDFVINTSLGKSYSNRQVMAALRIIKINTRK